MIPAFSVYARRVGPSSFLKFYFAENAADAAALFAHLETARVVASRFSDGIVVPEHRHLVEDPDLKTATVYATSLNVASQVPYTAFGLHGVVAITQFLATLPAETASAAFNPGDLRQIAGTLDALHKAGFAFGDVKPANVAYTQLRANHNATVFRLLDIDSLLPLAAGTPLLRTTQAFALPVLYSAPTGQDSASTILRNNDRFGFIGLLVAVLSGEQTARSVLQGQSYADDRIDQAVRQEIQCQVHALRERPFEELSESLSDWLIVVNAKWRQRGSQSSERSEAVSSEVAAFRQFWRNNDHNLGLARQAFDQYCEEIAHSRVRLVMTCWYAILATVVLAVLIAIVR